MSLKKNLPNYLTYFRILVIPALIVFFFVPGDVGFYVSSGLFLLACITDWLDGYVARLLKAESAIGKFLDPIADKLLVATSLLLLVERHPYWYFELPAIAIVCREILVSGLREFLACIHVGVPVSKLAKCKTAAQMGAIFFLLLSLGGPDWLHSDVLGLTLLWVAAVLTLFTAYAYMKVGIIHMMKESS